MIEDVHKALSKLSTKAATFDAIVTTSNCFSRNLSDDDFTLVGCFRGNHITYIVIWRL